MIVFPPSFPRFNRIVLVCGLVSLLTAFAGIVFVSAQNDDQKASANQPSIDQSTKARVAENLGKLPISFEINKGQVDEPVKFVSRGLGYDLFLTATEAVITLRKPRSAAVDKFKGLTSPAQVEVEGSVLRLKMIGAKADPSVEGQEELTGKINYFIGNDPERWRREIPTYRKVHYANVYPGIDMVYYGNQGELEYDFVVAPGANPNLIKFRIEGADRLRLHETGSFVLALKHGEVRLNKPLLYQLTAEGERREVKGEYVIKGNEIGFKVRGFDPSKKLVIDPVLSYSTFLGSHSSEFAFGIAVDSQGSAYVTGTTDSSTFPTTAGAFQTTNDFGAAFITKLDPTGSSLVYSTYISGSSRATGTSIAVDAGGNAHISGNTLANDFPLVNPLKTSASLHKTTDGAANWNNNNSDIEGDVRCVGIAPSAPNTMYASALSSVYRSTDSGTTWTKMAGSGLPQFPFVFSLTVDPTNPAVVYAGAINGGLFKTVNGGDNWTTVNLQQGLVSANTVVFDPVTPGMIYVGTTSGVFRSVDNGNTWNGLNNFGSPTPNVRTMAIDPNTPSIIYAGTIGQGVFKTTNSGGSWTPINSGLGGGNANVVNTIVIDPFNSSTLYSGHGNEGGNGRINKSENGGTSWFPLTTEPFPGINVIVADRTTPGTLYAGGLVDGVFKTTNGGTSWTNVSNGLSKSNVQSLVMHPSNSTTLFAGTFGNAADDAFITKLNASGSGLLFSTYLGGSNGESAQGIAVDSGGNIHVVGVTSSKNFPAVNAVQPTMTSSGTCNTDAFVTKINPAVPSYAFSTFLGGTKCEVASAVAVDSAANVYVTGNTESTDFPLSNAFQTTGDQFNANAFVTKLTSTGSFIYSTYLGGSGTDMGAGIAADTSGNAYVTGITTSSNFPTVSPLQATNGGDAGDVFVTKLNSQGSALVYSTYLGGSDVDIGRGIAVDATGNAYVTGYTRSLEFPLVEGALRTKSSLFKSVDGGRWSNDNYGLRGVPIYNIVLHPTQPWIIYATTSRGVFKSTNGGRTWTAINAGLTALNVTLLVIDPLTPSTLYLAANEPGTLNNGIYKSTDGGANWVLRTNGLVNTEFPSLAIDPVTPTTLYVGTFSGPIYKTTDGGDNWAPSGTGSPHSAFYIAVDPHTPTTIYAAGNSTNGGTSRSIDAGATWQQLTFDTMPSLLAINVSPHTPGLLYATSNAGLFKSVDNGAHWSLVTTRSGRIVFDPVNASTLYLLSIGEGVQKSTDGGQTWKAMNVGLKSPIATALAIDPLKPSTLHLVSTGDGGTEAFVSKINPSGTSLVYSTFMGGSLDVNDFNETSAQGLAIALDSSGNAYVTGLARITFPTTPTSYQPINRGREDAFIAKLSTSYIIKGHVLDGTSAPISGVEIVLSDGATLTSVQTESDGSYQFSRLREGGSFTISAAKPHFTITPASQTFNNLNSDQTLDFLAASSNAAFHTISGQITNNGVGLAGVAVTMSGSQPGIRTTDANGNYSFELIAGGNYTFTPSLVGFTFGSPSQTFNNLSASQAANFAATRQNFVVTNVNNHGAGSLREAITNANATLGPDTIVFNIPGPGVKVINVLNVLPEITEQVVIDATTQPGYAGAPLIELDGSALFDQSGLVIKAGGTTVRGLAIGRFSLAAILLSNCDNNTIQGNYIGTDATGTLKRPNGFGVLMSLSSNNLIGGTTAAARNVISGNQSYGIEIGGSGNIIQGNFIGTNAAGTAALENGSGVDIPTAPHTNNLIGGDVPGAGNLISGNSRGISVFGPANTIQGNLIGTDVTGTIKIPNQNGMEVQGPNNLVGGLTPGARNIISGNVGEGVGISGTGSKLQGNYIGTDITGTIALGGGGVSASDGALIGGTAAGARNIIAGNSAPNSVIVGSIGAGVTVQGNYIGTDVTGTRALTNGSFGISVGISVGGGNHLIGGTVAGAGNVISGHGVGIQLNNATLPPGNTIQGNFIGLNAAGTAALRNSQYGIELNLSSHNVIGGTEAGAANKIAFNGGAGIRMQSGVNNSIRGNAIFSNAGLGIDLSFEGVTGNDPIDSDNGANGLQNFPVLTSVSSNGSSTTIQGTLTSKANTTYQIDFYSNLALDPSGHGEGAAFFNSTSITTDGTGNATIIVTFPVALGAGRVITATATDPNGNTSEFSAGDATNAAGNLQFSVNQIWVIEDLSLATVTVVRKGGNVGSLSVDYATADGTAIAGEDYTATSGTLNFANGETSKTFQVPIINDNTTEPDEIFNIVLRNPSTLEALGSTDTLIVNLQDRNTVPFLFINDVAVIEGGPGTTTQLLFTLSLSAATGRTVSLNYATADGTAIGGASCSNAGTDYETASGSFTFDPGTTASPKIPIKVCGDSNAEASEFFVLNLSNPVNATIAISSGFGTIANDEFLSLILEDSGPGVNQAVAIDALRFVRDPFPVVSVPQIFANGTDRNTRVAFFATNLQLEPGENASAVIVRLVDSNNQTHNVAAESVRPVPNFDLTQVVIRLPDNLASGTCTVSIRAHGRISNLGTIRIAPQ